MKADNVHPKITILRQRGLSMVELMISLTIGLLLLTGLSMLFAESSRSHRELSEASKQIESGRYAIQLLGDDLHVAGFYGRWAPGAASSVPDPCDIASTTTLNDALPVHIQGYSAASFTARPTIPASPASTCSTYLPTDNLQPGSDVFAIRRTDTQAKANGDAITPNDVYMQANSDHEEIQLGGNGTIDTGSIGPPIDAGKKADGTAATILNKDGTAAPIRKYHVHVYFVAPCSMPAGGGDTCTGNADDGGKPIPTLKRLELTSVNGATAMKVVPLVEGIEMLKIDYGIDKISTPDDGTTVDSSPNTYVRPPRTAPMTADMTAADWANIMGVKIYILSRNPLLTAGYTNAKSYAMGLAGNYAPGGSYKRHVYTTSVRLTNPSMRREQ